MKLFTKKLSTCELCPNAVYAGSPWSGKLLSGPQAAKEAGVTVDPTIPYTSNAAYCKESKVMLPIRLEVTKRSWPLSDKTRTMPTFVIPAHCKLPNA